MTNPRVCGQPERAVDTVASANTETTRRGTCLDLAVLFAGLFLGAELLPLLIVFEDHAVVAVSQTRGRRDIHAPSRRERSYFEAGTLTDHSQLVDLVETSGQLVLECTGASFAEGLSADWPEGQKRQAGFMSFDRALKSGMAQLEARATTRS